MTDLTIPPTIAEALEGVGDRSLAIEDRAAQYSVLHQIQLRINRALKGAKDDLISHLQHHKIRQLGPLSLRSTALDVRYVCNDEDNWADITVQDAMAMLFKFAPDYIRHVPEHYEIRVAELGQGMAQGDPVAQQLFRELKAKGWRTEAGRRYSLAVQEAVVKAA